MIHTFIQIAFDILYWLILANIILSWIPHDRHNPIINFVYETTEPILNLFRGLIPRGNMPIDFSPIIAILVLSLLKKLILSIL